MICDDSLNDADDSFFELYSAKKVTNTYNAVLEELKTAPSKDETVIREQNVKVLKKPEDERKVPIRDDSLEIVVLDDADSPEEVIEESPGLRRSTRLRRKRKTAVENRNKRNKPNKRKKKDQDVEIVEIDINEEQRDIDSSIHDELNYEVSVKVLWESISVHTFRLRRFQKFTRIFEHFMKEHNVPIEKILLSLQATKIGPNDTPDSINLKAIDFIEGGIITDSIGTASKPATQTRCSNEKDCVVVKIQDVAKNIFKFSVGKNEPIKSVMIRYAEQIEVPLEKLKFYFEGETLKSSQTPASLGLDNDEIIDVKIMQ